MYRIGCDVGGTNTDAAIVDLTESKNPTSSSRGVLATAKTATTANVTDGITTVIEKVLQQSRVARDKILNIAIGTTHFVNAVVENDARHLKRVAVVRLCGPYTRSNAPFADYPYALRDIIEGPTFYLDGGLEVDGREITPLDVKQVERTAKAIADADISAVAVVGVFSALDHDGRHEETCRRIMLETCPQLSIVCSHSIGGPGFLVRENATILNATILSFARRTIRNFEAALQNLGLACPLFLTQNDGTLIEASLAAELPVQTFASGPTNSLMGAAFLQNIAPEEIARDRQLLVVDVGGTTTDVCALLPSGFPRKAPSYVDVGGVRTAFSMPEVFSTGLGGGSIIRVESKDKVTVGPDSVGHQLTTSAKVFGGEILTTTDIAVALGLVGLGESRLVKNIPHSTLIAAKSEIKRLVESAIDKMKVTADPAVVILVGGGSVIIGDNLKGVDRCLRPPHHDSANAVGAAIAGVSGRVDTIVVLENKDEASIVNEIRKQAIEAAVENGADPATIRITELNKIPLQYVSNNATRFVITAVGELDPKAKPSSTKLQKPEQQQALAEKIDGDSQDTKAKSATARPGSMATPTLSVDLTSYRPDLRAGVWYISPVDVELIALGCGILGTGGGGSSYNMALYVQDVLQRGGQGKIRVIAPESLQDADVCVFGSGYGAPSVSDERMDSGHEIFAAISELNKTLHIDDFDAIVADEIGGGNGLVTFPTSAKFDKPVVDCDLMGRAYPTAEHLTPCVYGHPLTPCSIADCNNNVSVVLSASSNSMVESMLRTQCIVLGNAAAVASRPLPGSTIKQCAIPNTVSQAWFLGRAVHLARRLKTDFVQAIQEVMPVRLLYTGKIIDVTRDVSRGYTVGKCTISPLSADEQENVLPPSSSSSSSTSSTSSTKTTPNETRTLIIPFQNEYLAAYLMNADEKNKSDAPIPKSSLSSSSSTITTTIPSSSTLLCTVPDLISILSPNGEALGSPDLRYGLHVRVISMPAHPLWTSHPEALRVGGPEFFGLGVDYSPAFTGEYQSVESVFDVFGHTS